jgi:hypothetical protein
MCVFSFFSFGTLAASSHSLVYVAYTCQTFRPLKAHAESGVDYERFLALALQRAVDEQRNYEAAGSSLRKRMARYRSHPKEPLYGIVADLTVIPNAAIAAAVSCSDLQTVKTVIVSTREVAFNFLGGGRIMLSAQSYTVLSLDMLDEVLLLHHVAVFVVQLTLIWFI